MTNTPHTTATITRDEMIAWLKSAPHNSNYRGDDKEMCDAIRDALSTPTIPAVPEGYVLVPVEPSEEMLKNASAIHYGGRLDQHHPRDILNQRLALSFWKGMLKKAPTPPSNGGWRPIEEADTTGYDGTNEAKRIFLYFPFDKSIHVGYWENYLKAPGWTSPETGDLLHMDYDYPTHFMPLPAPPKESK